MHLQTKYNDSSLYRKRSSSKITRGIHSRNRNDRPIITFCCRATDSHGVVGGDDRKSTVAHQRHRYEVQTISKQETTFYGGVNEPWVAAIAFVLVEISPIESSGCPRISGFLTVTQQPLSRLPQLAYRRKLETRLYSRIFRYIRYCQYWWSYGQLPPTAASSRLWGYGRDVLGHNTARRHPFASRFETQPI